MTISETATLVGIVATVGGILVAAARYVLNNAMREHVAPQLFKITEGLTGVASSNTTLAERLTETNEASRGFQSETRDAFGGIRDLLTDHHGRISALEAAKPAPKALRRAK